MSMTTKQITAGLEENGNQDVPQDRIAQAVIDLRIAFCAFQTDNKPTIKLRRLAEVVQLMMPKKEQPPTAKELAEMVGIDTSDGFENLWELNIDFKQFTRMFVTHINTGHIDVRTKEIFRAMDCDDSGEITAEELEESLTSMGMSINSEEALAMTSIADTSNEGLISYLQFKQICKRIDRQIIEEAQAKTVQQDREIHKNNPVQLWKTFSQNAFGKAHNDDRDNREEARRKTPSFRRFSQRSTYNH